MKSIDTSNIGKTLEKKLKMMVDVVEEVSEENVIQIVIDNATNYKAAQELLMHRRKKVVLDILCSPLHSFNVGRFLEDFVKIRDKRFVEI